MVAAHEPPSPETLRRLRWRARRGLLENDLVLERFFAIHGRDLQARHAGALAVLLEMDDGDLWDLISGRTEPAAALREVVQWLRAC